MEVYCPGDPVTLAPIFPELVASEFLGVCVLQQESLNDITRDKKSGSIVRPRGWSQVR